MNARYVTAFLIFLVSFAAGLGLTRLFLKNTSPATASAQGAPTVIADDVQRETSSEKDDSDEHFQPPTATAKTHKVPITNPSSAPVLRPWWTGLRDQRCRVNLGSTTSLRIRKGSLEDGEVISWEKQFAQNPQVGQLLREENPIVLVHGVGVDEHKRPVAAHISLTGAEAQETGIIALSVNDVRVTLYPVDDENQTP